MVIAGSGVDDNLTSWTLHVLVIVHVDALQGEVLPYIVCQFLEWGIECDIVHCYSKVTDEQRTTVYIGTT